MMKRFWNWLVNKLGTEELLRAAVQELCEDARARNKVMREQIQQMATEAELRQLAMSNLLMTVACEMEKTKWEVLGAFERSYPSLTLASLQLYEAAAFSLEKAMRERLTESSMDGKLGDELKLWIRHYLREQHWHEPHEAVMEEFLEYARRVAESKKVAESEAKTSGRIEKF